MTRYNSRRSSSPRAPVGGPAPTHFVVDAAVFAQREPLTQQITLWQPAGGLPPAQALARKRLLSAAVSSWRLAGAPVQAKRQFSFQYGENKEKARYGRRLVLTPAQLEDLWTLVEPESATLQLPGPEGQALGPLRLTVWGRSLVQVTAQGWPTGFTAPMVQSVLEAFRPHPVKVFSVAPVMEEGVAICGEFNLTIVLPTAVSSHQWILDTPEGSYTVYLHPRLQRFRPPQRGPLGPQGAPQPGRQQPWEPQQAPLGEQREQQGTARGPQQQQARGARAAARLQEQQRPHGASPPGQQQPREQQQAPLTEQREQQGTARGPQQQSERGARTAAGIEEHQRQQGAPQPGQQQPREQQPAPSREQQEQQGTAKGPQQQRERGARTATGMEQQQRQQGEHEQAGPATTQEQAGRGGDQPPHQLGEQGALSQQGGALAHESSSGGATGTQQQPGASVAGPSPAKRPPGSPGNIAERKRAKRDRKRELKEVEQRQQQQQQQGTGAAASAGPVAASAASSWTAPPLLVRMAPNSSWQGALDQYLEDQASELKPEQQQQVTVAFFRRFAVETSTLITTDRPSGLPFGMLSWLRAELAALGVVLTYPDSDSDSGSVASMDTGDVCPPHGA